MWCGDWAVRSPALELALWPPFQKHGWRPRCQCHPLPLTLPPHPTPPLRTAHLRCSVKEWRGGYAYRTAAAARQPPAFWLLCPDGAAGPRCNHLGLSIHMRMPAAPLGWMGQKVHASFLAHSSLPLSDACLQWTISFHRGNRVGRWGSRPYLGGHAPIGTDSSMCVVRCVWAQIRWQWLLWFVVCWCARCFAALLHGQRAVSLLVARIGASLRMAAEPAATL